jgi:hypothetical protein
VPNCTKKDALIVAFDDHRRETDARDCQPADQAAVMYRQLGNAGRSLRVELSGLVALEERYLPVREQTYGHCQAPD